MLEPTEPTQGSEQNTPSDTLPPRRRRRAASRPAGPPAGTSDSTAETVAPVAATGPSEPEADQEDTEAVAAEETPVADAGTSEA
ncbi:hypothetical protein G3I31_05430, partial [Streptomyces sp. SID9913]